MMLIAEEEPSTPNRLEQVSRRRRARAIRSKAANIPGDGLGSAPPIPCSGRCRPGAATRLPECGSRPSGRPVAGDDFGGGQGGIVVRAPRRHGSVAWPSVGRRLRLPPVPLSRRIRSRIVFADVLIGTILADVGGDEVVQSTAGYRTVMVVVRGQASLRLPLAYSI